MANLTSKALLVNLHIPGWSAEKKDKKVTDQTNSDHGAAMDAGNYNKHIISKVALAEIKSAAGYARTYHYAHTLPWHDTGARILPAAAYLEYMKEMGALRARFDSAVRTFLDKYPEFVAARRAELGSMFDERDYPNAQRISRKFNFDIVVDPLPSVDDFRVNLSDGEIAKLQADYLARSDRMIQEAVQSLWQRVADVVGKMAESLRGYEPGGSEIDIDGKVKKIRATGTFKDTLVGNVRDLVALLPTLNVTNNPDLSAMTERMEALCKHEPEDLRDSEFTRSVVAHTAEALLADMAGYLGGIDD